VKGLDMDCHTLQPLLAAYVDHGPGVDRTMVEAHLATCPACGQALEVQRVMRQALSRHGRDTLTPVPPGLRTRLAATLAAEARPAVEVGWRTRLSAFAAAAVLVLAVGAVAIPVVTGRSTVVLAAQMALDHLKCFTIDGHDHGETLTVAEAEAELFHEYGWQIDVPETGGAAEGRLVAVRRCLYGDGRAAHLLYRVGSAPVSLFILPGLERPAAELSLLGHDEVVWSAGGRTYMLVGGEGSRGLLRQMASTLRNEAQ
jgi:anti-sigma factor RsiW